MTTAGPHLCSAQTPAQPAPNPASQPVSREAQDGGKAAGKPAVGDAERDALTLATYDLSLQIVPAESRLAAVARLSIQNDGPAPIERIPLQISSSLKWESFSTRSAGRAAKLQFDQHLIETDADHTGKVSEAIILLPEPLKPHARIDLLAIYSGTVARSAGRLERTGVSSSSGDSGGDWDEIAATGTSLRGFGDVIWYPVASSQVFAGEGATFLTAINRQKLREAGAKVHLRLTVSYTGEAPSLAFFCGRGKPLQSISENADAPVATAPGVATVDFPESELGFRMPSLFITGNSATVAGGLVKLIPADSAAGAQISAAAKGPQGLLSDWLGPDPLEPLTIVDHPGTPFEDGPFLVSSFDERDRAGLPARLAQPMAHAWFRSSHLWLDEGVPQWFASLWTERSEGRAAAIAELSSASHTLALAESTSSPEQEQARALLNTSDPIFYRTKAAAVLWLLRGIVGDDALKRALKRYRRDPRDDRDGHGFETVLETESGKKLDWFFEDWVYHDRGLPDLSIMSAAPRQMSGAAGSGWLVAVEVRNQGQAAAEVPVTVRSGSLTATESLRIPAGSAASTRIVFQGVPEEVQVNDGSVPEMLTGVHIRKIETH
jgi:hypothetical protein